MRSFLWDGRRSAKRAKKFSRNTSRCFLEALAPEPVGSRKRICLTGEQNSAPRQSLSRSSSGRTGSSSNEHCPARHKAAHNTKGILHNAPRTSRIRPPLLAFRAFGAYVATRESLRAAASESV